MIISLGLSIRVESNLIDLSSIFQLLHLKRLLKALSIRAFRPTMLQNLIQNVLIFSEQIERLKTHYALVLSFNYSLKTICFRRFLVLSLCRSTVSQILEEDLDRKILVENLDCVLFEHCFEKLEACHDLNLRSSIKL